jgi:D-sedoheptulose 7-phosphate isomerase
MTTKQILDKLFSKYIELMDNYELIENTIELLRDCYNNGNKVLVCGNGGSSADSQHIVGELMKNFKIKRELPLSLKEKIKLYFNDISNYVFDNVQFGLFTMSLAGETALITALCNDSKPDLVYASQVLSAGKDGDVLLVISTSGNSKNVIYACKMAKVKGMKVIGLTGKHGGELNNCTDILIKAPSEETYLVQEYHLSIYHTICACVENEIFGE